MRLTIMTIALATVLGACSEKKEDMKTEVQPVTPENAYNNSAMTDTGKAVVTKAVAPSEPVKTTKAPATKPVSNNTNTTATTNTPAPAPAPTPAPTTTTENTGTQASTGTNNTGTATTTTEPEPEKKKGISNTAKGAIIGGVAGAMGGAIVSKKKGKGALIGGILGAGAGAIIGKKKDKQAAAKDSAQ